MNLVKAYNHFQISKRRRKKETKYFASADTLCQILASRARSDEVNLEGKANFYCSTNADNLMYIHSKGKKNTYGFYNRCSNIFHDIDTCINFTWQCTTILIH